MMSDISARPQPGEQQDLVAPPPDIHGRVLPRTVIPHNNTASASVLPRTFFIIDPVFVL